MTAIINARAAWLALRRERLTASDVAAILGFDRRKPSDVYLAKLGLVEEPDSEPMKWGRRFEDGVAQGYAEETGRPVYALPPFELWQHPSIPWLAATGDRETEIEGERVPLELKWAPVTGDRWESDAPLAYQMQAQFQMECRPASRAALCGFVSPFKAPAHFDLVRNEVFLRSAIAALETFWHHLEARTMPSDAEWYSTESVRKLWPADNGQTVALDASDQKEADDLERAREARLDAEHAEERFKLRMAVRMRDAARGYLPDGSSVVYESAPVAAQLCECGRQVKKEHVRRTMRRWWPKHLRLAAKRAKELGR